MNGDRQTSSATERFLVADRSVGWLLGSLTLTATQVSAGTLVGAIGIHYLYGVSFIVVWPGIWLGWLVSLYYVAPQLRRFGGVTVPEYLAARYPDDGAGGRRMLTLSSILIGGIYLVLAAAQYIAGGVVVETVLGVPATHGMAGIFLLTVAYTASGGMRASIMTDVVLVAAVIVALVVAAFFGVLNVGGPAALYRGVHAVDPALLGVAMPADELAGFAIAFGLAMTVAPYQINRIYAMTDEAAVRRSIRGTILIQAVMAVCIMVIGLVAIVALPALTNPDAAVGALVEAIFGPVAGWLLVVGVLAAIVSTLDSILLVTASAVGYDLYLGIIRGRTDDGRGGSASGGATRGWLPFGAAEGLSEPEDHRAVLVTRVAVVLAAAVPIGMALTPGVLGELVQVVVALYASLIASALFAPVFFGLHWKPTTAPGAAAGISAGVVAVIGWHLLRTVYGLLPAPLGSLPTPAIGVLASALAVVIGSKYSYDSPRR